MVVRRRSTDKHNIDRKYHRPNILASRDDQIRKRIEDFHHCFSASGREYRPGRNGDVSYQRRPGALRGRGKEKKREEKKNEGEAAKGWRGSEKREIKRGWLTGGREKRKVDEGGRHPPPAPLIVFPSVEK